MGTMLQSAGLTDGGAPELWNVTTPDRVKSIYRGYGQAGSNVITTNTFGGTAARLKLHNHQDRVVEFNRAGALLAREVAAETGALVAGDIGPSGELIEPVGPLSIADAQALFAEQVQGLVEGGVDFILIETMSHLNEAEAAVRATQQVAPNLPIAVTLSFDTNFHTMMGVSPRQAVQTIATWGVKVIGANCGNGPAEIETVMTQMAQHRPAGVYLMAQSNAGMPKWMDGQDQLRRHTRNYGRLCRAPACAGRQPDWRLLRQHAGTYCRHGCHPARTRQGHTHSRPPLRREHIGYADRERRKPLATGPPPAAPTATPLHELLDAKTQRRGESAKKSNRKRRNGIEPVLSQAVAVLLRLLFFALSLRLCVFASGLFVLGGRVKIGIVACGAIVREMIANRAPPGMGL